MTEEEIQAWKAMWDNAERITLSEKDYDALVERLENPPPPSPQFIAMLKKRPPWEDPDKK
jgi:uncharacterized protein (DUF1778 family)